MASFSAFGHKNHAISAAGGKNWGAVANSDPDSGNLQQVDYAAANTTLIRSFEQVKGTADRFVDAQANRETDEVKRDVGQKMVHMLDDISKVVETPVHASVKTNTNTTVVDEQQTASKYHSPSPGRS